MTKISVNVVCVTCGYGCLFVWMSGSVLVCQAFYIVASLPVSLLCCAPHIEMSNV